MSLDISPDLVLDTPDPVRPEPDIAGPDPAAFAALTARAAPPEPEGIPLSAFQSDAGSAMPAPEPVIVVQNDHLPAAHEQALRALLDLLPDALARGARGARN